MINADLQAQIFLLGSAGMVLTALLIINYIFVKSSKHSKQITSTLPDNL